MFGIEKSLKIGKKSLMFRTAVLQPFIFKTLFKIILPPFLRTKIKNFLSDSNVIGTPIILKDDKKKLKLLFSKDVCKLEELINIELKDWK